MRRFTRVTPAVLFRSMSTMVPAIAVHRLYSTQPASEGGELLRRIPKERIFLPETPPFGEWICDPPPDPDFLAQEHLRQQLIVDHFINSQREAHDKKHRWGNYRTRKERALQDKLARLKGEGPRSDKRTPIGMTGTQKIPSSFSFSEGGPGGIAHSTPIPGAQKPAGPPRIVAARRRRNVGTD